MSPDPSPEDDRTDDEPEQAMPDEGDPEQATPDEGEPEQATPDEGEPEQATPDEAETSASSEVTTMTDSSAESSPTDDEDTVVDVLKSAPWIPSVLAGAGSFLGGYVLMAALFFVGPASTGSGPFVEQLKQIGYVFYNAHFVDGVISISSEELQVAGSSRVNLLLDEGIAELSTSIPVPVYFAVPVVALLVAGGLLAFVYPAMSDDSVSIGLAGVGMALGYAALAVAGSFVVVRSMADGGATFAPDPLQSLAMGFAYPFVLGVVGLAVGSLLDRR